MTTATLNDPLLNINEDFLRDPYRFYRQLRESDPIFWSKSGGYWIITRYAEADMILRDLRFGKRMDFFRKSNSLASRLFMKIASCLDPGFQAGQSMLHQNPPDHTRLRSLVNKAFTPKMVEQMRVHIQAITDDLINKAKPKGSIDLVADFAFPLPVTVIAEMLGVPASDRERFKHWSNSLTSVLEPGASTTALIAAAIARKKLVSYLLPLIEERRKNPQEDLISSLAQAEEAGNKLTQAELLANIVLLLVAGHETTVNLIASSALALMTHPDQMALLKDQPELLNNAVEEFLRWTSPVQIVRRFAGEDVQLNGKLIKSGQAIVICVGAANRDPEMFPDPDRLDITRSSIKHLAYGFGIHHCLGSSLASAEGQIAIGTLLKRMPGIKLNIDPERIEWKRPFSLRGPKKLPVTF